MSNNSMFRNILRYYASNECNHNQHQVSDFPTHCCSSIPFTKDNLEDTLNEFLTQVTIDYPDLNIDELILYKPQNPNHVVTGRILFEDSNYELFVLCPGYPRFFHIKNVLFNDEDLILTCNNDNIQYTLYAFKQGQEAHACSFYDEKDLVNLEITYDRDNSFSIKWIDDMYLHIKHEGFCHELTVTYSISKHDIIISSFVDSKFRFQLCEWAKAYLHGNDLILDNIGDLSSLIIIKYRGNTKSANKV